MAIEEQSQLVDRIVDYLRSNGGRTNAEAVCSDVLGLSNCDAPTAYKIVTAGLARDSRIGVSRGGEVYLKDTGRKDPLISRLRYAVIDLETTGLPHPEHRVTEIAAVLVEGGKIVDDFSTLVNPGIPIPKRIVHMTGITNEMVADAPPFEEVADPLVEIIGRRVLIAHNSPFDVNFLNAELTRAKGIRLANPSLCTVRLARKLVTGLDSYRLDSVANYFNVEIGERHRALGDAAATAAVFIRLCEIAADRGLLRLSQLQKIAGVRLNSVPEKHNSDNKKGIGEKTASKRRGKSPQM
jgi:DNA polymerase-3 subunit epsilon